MDKENKKDSVDILTDHLYEVMKCKDIARIEKLNSLDFECLGGR